MYLFNTKKQHFLSILSLSISNLFIRNTLGRDWDPDSSVDLRLFAERAVGKENGWKIGRLSTQKRVLSTNRRERRAASAEVTLQTSRRLSVRRTPTFLHIFIHSIFLSLESLDFPDLEFISSF